MNCLVVVAHPLENSLCHYLSNSVIQYLESKGYNITVKDLYKDKFNPVLTHSERMSYYEEEFHINDIHDDIQQLLSAESLVLIFPTWWFGFPAILKGWFDRVWAPGHAFDHGLPIKPRLDKLTDVKVITTLGSPWWVDKFILRQPVKRVLKTAILGSCAKNCRFKMLSLHSSENVSKEKIDKFIKKIKISF